MTQSILTINYSRPIVSAPPLWVKLEQIIPQGLRSYASIKDLYDLWLAAKTGRSAQNIRLGDVCPVEVEGKIVRLWIDFYVWLSDPSLPYSVSAGIGSFSAQEVTNTHKEFSLVVEDAAYLNLPYYFGPDIEVFWESATFDSLGEQIHNVTITVVNGNRLYFSEEVFGVVRVSGSAAGFKQRLTLEVEALTDQATGEYIEYTLTEFNVDIIVTTDFSEETMHLSDSTLPECVRELLSRCPNQENIDLCTSFAERGLLGKILTVFYNSCTGEVLSTSLSDMQEGEFCR